MTDVLARYTFGAVVPAAGCGVRMGGTEPKLFALINGRPVLALVLDALLGLEFIGRVVIAARAADHARIRDEVIGSGRERPVTVIEGGGRRQDSVAAGASALGTVDFLVIHDGARPLVDPADIRRTAQAALTGGAADLGVRAKATIKVADADGIVTATPDRSQLWEAQTPQVIRADLFRQGMLLVAAAGLEVTDDAQVAAQAGARVQMVAGSYRNLKITTPEDLILARALAAEERRHESR